MRKASDIPAVENAQDSTYEELHLGYKEYFGILIAKLIKSSKGQILVELEGDDQDESKLMTKVLYYRHLEVVNLDDSRKKLLARAQKAFGETDPPRLVGFVQEPSGPRCFAALKPNGKLEVKEVTLVADKQESA